MRSANRLKTFSSTGPSEASIDSRARWRMVSWPQSVRRPTPMMGQSSLFRRSRRYRARKMTFRALYRLERRNKLDCPIIGVGRRTDWGHETMRQRARESIEASLGPVDEKVFKRLADRMRFVAGNFDDSTTYDVLHDLSL